MWLVHLVGSSSTRQYLIDNSVPFATVVDRNGALFMSSREFQEEHDPWVVLAKARDMCRVLQGLGDLIGQDYGPFEVDYPMQVDDDGNTRLFVRDRVAIRDEVTVEVFNQTGQVIKVWNSRENLSNIGHAIDFYPLVRTVLSLWGSPDLTFRELCVILEIIRYDDYATYAKFSQNELDRLFRTANSIEAAGVGTRHGPKRQQPPRHPMLLDHAKTLTKTVLKEWLQNKIV